jgi:hypothetical protein
MGGEIRKKVLSEISLMYGDVLMPKGFEIDRNKLIKNILKLNIKKFKPTFCKTVDILNTYINEHVNLNFKINLINKHMWGDVYKPNQTSVPMLNVDPMNYRNSPDFTCLYGVQTNDCMVKICYDNNRLKGNIWDIELKTNMFLIFPSTCMYYLTNNQKDSLNFVQTISYESK